MTDVTKTSITMTTKTSATIYAVRRNGLVVDDRFAIESAAIQYLDWCRARDRGYGVQWTITPQGRRT